MPTKKNKRAEKMPKAVYEAVRYISPYWLDTLRHYERPPQPELSKLHHAYWQPVRLTVTLLNSPKRRAKGGRGG